MSFNYKSAIKNGMKGLIVGDALGGSVQFMDRKTIQNECPVTGMREVEPFDLPAGSWSDDSSMALATLDSITQCGDIDLHDIMEKFVAWRCDGKYTPFGFAFDVGNACGQAVFNYRRDGDVNSCGLSGEYNNGNGSVMRILPVSVYALDYVTNSEDDSDDTAIEIVERVGALTHSHRISMMGCGFHYFVTKGILQNPKMDLKERIKTGLEEAFAYYEEEEDTISYYSRLREFDEFVSLPEDEISSSGYVVSTLEAAIWCLCNTERLEDVLLKAVNLGDDSDSVGAVVGGLAGLYYGEGAIPVEWWEVIQNVSVIEGVFN